jgi:hypothetical protein
MTSIISNTSNYSVFDPIGTRPYTMSPGGSICSGATVHNLRSDCDTGDDNSDTGSDQSRFSRTRKHRVKNPKTMMERRVGEQNKRKEGRSMSHQGLVVGDWRKHTGSRTGTMSPRGSIRSGETACTDNSDYDTGDDDLDNGSDRSRFSRLNSRVNSTQTLDSQHASTNIYQSAAARRKLDGGPKEDREKTHIKVVQGRTREQEKMTENRNEEHQATVEEFQRKQQLNQVPSCLDSMVSDTLPLFEYPSDRKGGTAEPGESIFEDPPYWAREAEHVEADMSFFNRSYCGCHFPNVGRVEPPSFTPDDTEWREWEYFKRGMPPANRGTPGVILESETQSVSRGSQHGNEGVKGSSCGGVVSAE